MIAEERRAPPLSKPTPSTTTTYALWNTWHFFFKSNGSFGPNQLPLSGHMDTLAAPEHSRTHLFSKTNSQSPGSGSPACRETPKSKQSTESGSGERSLPPPGSFLGRGYRRQEDLGMCPSRSPWVAGCITCFCLAH